MTSEATVKYGWTTSYMYNSLMGGDNPTSPTSGHVMSIFPSDLRAVMKLMNKYCFSSSGQAYCPSEYLTLLSCYEIFGTSSSANGLYPSEATSYQKQYDYYSAGNSKTKVAHTDGSSWAPWWTRTCSSDSSGNTGEWAAISRTRALSYLYDEIAGIAPIFMV